MKPLNLRFRAYRMLSLRTASTFIRHIHSSGVKNSQGEWQLRAYQDECISACFTAIEKGLNRIGVSLPTGSGKTTTFVALLHQLPVNEMRPAATKSIIIVNSVHLANQTVHQVKRLFPNTTVEVERGEHVATGEADITVSTFQTLRKRLQKFPPERIKAVIVDEAHHAAAPTYISILSHFDPRISPTGSEITTPSPPIIGFSATFSRHDDLPLGKVFEAIVYHRDFLDMIKAEWLCDVRFTTVMAQIDLSSIETSDTGDFKSADLGRVMNTNKMNAAIAQSWLEKAVNRKSTIIFCADLAHVHGVTNEFRKRGVDAHSVDGKTPEKAREQLLRDFRAGNFPVIVNCGVLLEGADFPNIDCVMVARPTCSRNLFVQMIGRGMRLSPETGKQNCHIIDFVDSRRDMEDVFSTSSLFQLHPHDSIEDVPLKEMLKRKANEETENGEMDSESQDIKNLNYEDHYYSDPFSLQYHSHKQQIVSDMSPFAWVYTRHDGCYKLGCKQKGVLVLSDHEGEWSLDYLPVEDIPNLRAVVGAPKESVPTSEEAIAQIHLESIEKSTSLSKIVKDADEFARKHLQIESWSSERNSRWRRGPLFDWQKDYIGAKLGLCPDSTYNYDAPENHQVRSWIGIPDMLALNRLNLGEAFDVMLQLWGARREYKKEFDNRASFAKRGQILKKGKARRTYQTVKVGPLKSE